MVKNCANVTDVGFAQAIRRRHAEPDRIRADRWPALTPHARALGRAIEADALLECVLTATAFLAAALAAWSRQLLAAAA